MPSRSTLIRGWAFRRSGWGAVHPWCHLGDPWPPVRLSLHAHAFSQRLGSAHRVAHGGGLVGLHARQAGVPGYGLLGTVGFVLASVGDLLLATLGPFVYSAVPGGAFPFMMVMFVYVVVAWWGMICWGWPPCARLSCRCLGGLCRWPSSSWTYPLRRWRVR